MKRQSQHNRRCVLASGLVVALGVGAGCGGSGGELGTDESFEVRRGRLTQRHLMTGAFEALESADVVVPQTNEWQLQIKWLVSDGAMVSEGETVVEFDNSSFTANLDQQRTALQRARRTLLQTRAGGEARMREAEASVERARITLAKAEIDASVPESVRSRYDHRTFQLAITKARAAYEKARADLRSTSTSVTSENLVSEEQYRKVERELEMAEEAVSALVLKAPRDGIVVVEEHPWEDRKYQVGDSLYPGWVVLGIPDLDRLRVRASLSDVDDGAIEPGMTAVCTPDIEPGLQIPCTVVGVTEIARERRIFSERRGFDVTVAIGADVGDVLLVPGMSVRVEVATERPESLLIPRACVDFATDPPRALKPNGDWIPIEVGPCSAQDCVLVAGLAAGAELAFIAVRPS